MRGTLFDIGPVIAAAEQSLKAHPCRERCTMVSGSFLESVPRDFDAYLMTV
jgi:hypothetical protein